MVYANGLFVTHGRYYYGQIWYSPDGVTWSRDTSVTNGINYYNAFAYGNGRFVAVGEDDSVLLSTSNSWSLAQTGFQFRNDNGSEVAATSIGGQNSSLAYPANATVRLRTQIDSALATTTTPYYLQYKNIATENFWHTVGVDDPYPRIRSVWSGSGSANATTHSLNKTQCEAGDLNLVIFSHDGVQTSRTTSTGWKKLGEASNGISVTGAIYYKFADGVDALTITTVSSEEASYVSYCIAGAGTPSASAAEGNSTNSNPPLHTTDAVRSNLFMVTRSGDSTVVASAAPSSYSSLG